MSIAAIDIASSEWGTGSLRTSLLNVERQSGMELEKLNFLCSTIPQLLKVGVSIAEEGAATTRPSRTFRFLLRGSRSPIWLRRGIRTWLLPCVTLEIYKNSTRFEENVANMDLLPSVRSPNQWLKVGNLKWLITWQGTWETIKFMEIISEAWFAHYFISVDNWTWSSSSVAASRASVHPVLSKRMVSCC